MIFEQERSMPDRCADVGASVDVWVSEAICFISNQSVRGDALFLSVSDAVSLQDFDKHRATLFACFASSCGNVRETVVLQVGSLEDIAFYERQVVELCFSYKLNSVVLNFYFPKGPASVPKSLVSRLNRFSKTLHAIEMSMPYVLWTVGVDTKVFRTLAHERASICN